MMKRLRIGVFVAATLASAGASAQGPSLAAARELYVSAEYASALQMLTALAGGNPSRADRQAIDLHRVLCLMALDNAAEATQVVETMLTRDPLYRPDVTDLPPRVRAVFTDARKRLLPGIVQQRYVVARAAFEQKEFAVAAEGFQLVLKGLSDPDIGGVSEQPPLSDLKLLATGFHDLAAKALPSFELVEETPTPPPPSRPATPAAAVVYSAENLNVAPPQTIRQVVPPFPGRVVSAGVATIDIVINEMGGVDAASIVTPLHPQYDRMALNAAKNWLYKPAMLNGVPVKYRKRLQLTITPEAQPR
ncbi:MAG TPA: TonB family protein [Vicinamibacterales bacterium]